MPRSLAHHLQRKGRRGAPATASYAAVPVYLPDDLGVGVDATPLLDLFEAPAYRYGLSSDLLPVEDRRSWSPGAAAPPLDYSSARTVIGSPARLRASARHSTGPGRVAPTFSPVVAFQTPSRVNICIRRQRRKEVLHAKRFYGRAKLRRPTRNAYSSISCRR